MTETNATSEPAAPFSPELVTVINCAYETAIETLGITQAHSDRRAILADCIMRLARAGERDETILRERAIEEVRQWDRVRERAHEIWNAEGRPEGRRDEHWRRASHEIG